MDKGVGVPGAGEEQPLTEELKPTPQVAGSISRSAGEAHDVREQVARRVE